eukprot:6183471-Pleurochrysis_carterae.AAC.6
MEANWAGHSSLSATLSRGRKTLSLAAGETIRSAITNSRHLRRSGIHNISPAASVEVNTGTAIAHAS